MAEDTDRPAKTADGATARRGRPNTRGANGRQPTEGTGKRPRGRPPKQAGAGGASTGGDRVSEVSEERFKDKIDQIIYLLELIAYSSAGPPSQEFREYIEMRYNALKKEEIDG